MEDLGCVTCARSRGVPADDEAADADQVWEVEDPPDLVLSEDEDAGHGSGPGPAAEQPVVQKVPGPPYGGAGGSGDLAGPAGHEEGEAGGGVQRQGQTGGGQSQVGGGQRGLVSM